MVGDTDNVCFGEDFYNDLIVSIHPCVGYDSQADYSIGSIVVYDGNYYQATVGINQSSTGTVLPISSGGLWVEVGKFQNANYNTLWKKYLAEYLAYCVIHGTVYKKSIRNTAQGYVRNQPDKAEAAEVAELRLIKDDFLQDIQILWNRMRKYLIKNKDLFPLFPENCANVCNNRRRAGVYLAPSKNKNCECNR